MSEKEVGTVGLEAVRPVDTVRSQKTIFGHPAGLYVLFCTEMWERVCYYGMRALLVLYLVDYLIVGARAGSIHVFGFSALEHGIQSIFGPLGVAPLASQIYGLFTAFVYFTPLFGGMLADRVLGQRKSVVLGAILMAAGQFLMMMDSTFLIALAVLILGNGCFKPNICTQVGNLYPPGDPRRDRAFTTFYVGVNLGAFISPLICGTLGQVYGWRYGFGAAGVGMLIGLTIYLAGQRYGAGRTDPDPRGAFGGKASPHARGVEGHRRPCPFLHPQRRLLGSLRAAGQYAAVVCRPQHRLACFLAGKCLPPGFSLSIPCSSSCCTPSPVHVLELAIGPGQAKSRSVNKMAIGCFLLGISFFR